jgi:regulator of protease activity HflC (stomatin/prohibitin superfamily)
VEIQIPQTKATKPNLKHTEEGISMFSPVKMFGGGAIVLVAAILGLGSCTTIDTGQVGVQSQFGQISKAEIPAGVTTKLPMITSIDSYNVRETTLDLNDLTPKAKDNLSLRELDVSVMYEVNSAKVADTVIEFAGQSPYNETLGVYMPGQGIVTRLSREAVYTAVADMESLTIHQRREALSAAIKNALQVSLDRNAPDTFRVTNVAIRAVTTDESIEASIREAVQTQKQLETKVAQEKVAEANARIAITTAKGEAEANRILAQSLTPELLRKQANDAMYALARSGNSSTIVLPSGATPLVQVK